MLLNTQKQQRLLFGAAGLIAFLTPRSNHPSSLSKMQTFLFSMEWQLSLRCRGTVLRRWLLCAVTSFCVGYHQHKDQSIPPCTELHILHCSVFSWKLCPCDEPVSFNGGGELIVENPSEFFRNSSYIYGMTVFLSWFFLSVRCFFLFPAFIHMLCELCLFVFLRVFPPVFVGTDLARCCRVLITPSWCSSGWWDWMMRVSIMSFNHDAGALAHYLAN